MVAGELDKNAPGKKDKKEAKFTRRRMKTHEDP